jgi:two-component system OmpR family sensor kinase
LNAQRRSWHVWERISLRTKLTALSVSLIGLLLAVSSIGTMTLLKTYLQKNTDDLLFSTVAALSHEDPNGLELRLAERKLQLPRLPMDYYIAYVDPQGGLLKSLVPAVTASDDLPDLTLFTTDYVADASEKPFELISTNEKTHTQKSWRILAAPITAVTEGSLIVGIPTTSSDALLEQYRTIGNYFAAFLLLLSGLAIWFTITSALKPLREVERTAAAVSEGDISKRLLQRPGRTEISRLNSSLNSMLNSIEGAMNLRNATLTQMRRFVADASHELRTPLVSVRGYAELYRMGALQKPEDIAEAMGRIESEAIRMTGLVESLLTLARLDDDNKKSLSHVDVLGLARSVAKDSLAADASHTIELVDLLSVPVMPNATLEAEADADQMRQVLTNLLANAGRFAPVGSKVELAIGLPLGKHNQTIRIEVRDKGEGIPPELREKIFERFFRADSSRNRETGGSGLGLAIVKSIVERHGGTIVANETPGGGATFRVDLPVTQAQ